MHNMGIFREDERKAAGELKRFAVDALDKDESEGLKDIQFGETERLTETQEEAIETGATVAKKRLDKPGLRDSKDFTEHLPGLVHETRSEVAQGADEAREADERINPVVTGGWADWLEKPGQVDYEGVDDK